MCVFFPAEGIPTCRSRCQSPDPPAWSVSRPWPSPRPPWTRRQDSGSEAHLLSPPIIDYKGDSLHFYFFVFAHNVGNLPQNSSH